MAHPEPLYGDYYREIYAKGLAGERPAQPVAITELEAAAKEALDERAVAYIWGGAGGEDTMRENLEPSAAGESSPVCCATSPSAT